METTTFCSLGGSTVLVVFTVKNLSQLPISSYIELPSSFVLLTQSCVYKDCYVKLTLPVCMLYAGILKTLSVLSRKTP